jgi:hypothetical protein
MAVPPPTEDVTLVIRLPLRPEPRSNFQKGPQVLAAGALRYLSIQLAVTSRLPGA